jgi:hypothetical protein
MSSEAKCKTIIHLGEYQAHDGNGELIFSDKLFSAVLGQAESYTERTMRTCKISQVIATTEADVKVIVRRI